MSFDMSTQPLPRLRLPNARRRQPRDVTALVVMLLSSAAVFAAVFALAREHTSSVPGEPLPASLPSLSEPVPASLGPAPAIELGVQQSPPPKPVSSTRSQASTAPSSSTSTTTANPTVAPATQTAPATTTTPTATAPVTHSGGAAAPPRHTAPSSSPPAETGTSFDSSG